MARSSEHGETVLPTPEAPEAGGTARPNQDTRHPGKADHQRTIHADPRSAARNSSAHTGEAAMSREALCLFLRECEVVQERYQRLSGNVSGQESRLHSMRRQARRHHFQILFYLAVSALFLLLLVALPTPLKVFRTGSDSAGYPSYFVMVLFFCSLYKAASAYVRLFILRRKLAKESARLGDERYRLHRAELHLHRLRERDILPDAYWIHTVRLRSYLAEERADTIPEAIRLMEKEEAEERLHRELFSRLDRALTLLEKAVEHR